MKATEAAPASPPPLLQVCGLHKRFGRRSALRGVDLTLNAGEALTVFGPNGAGKTTLVRCLATLVRPTEGSIHLDGVELRRASHRVRRRIGVVSHESFLSGALTARENLEFYAGMFGVAAPADRAERVAEAVGLGDRLDDPVRTFSRGLRQRCAIARALLHEPEILIFDEPFAGLDPVAADDLRELLRAARGAGRTVILTSHDLERGRDLADRLLVLLRGRVAFDAPAEALDADELAARYRALSGARRDP